MKFDFLINCFDLFLDDSGVFRVGGCVYRGNFNIKFKYLIIILRKFNNINLLMCYYYERIWY